MKQNPLSLKQQCLPSLEQQCSEKFHDTIIQQPSCSQFASFLKSRGKFKRKVVCVLASSGTDRSTFCINLVKQIQTTFSLGEENLSSFFIKRTTTRAPRKNVSEDNIEHVFIKCHTFFEKVKHNEIILFYYYKANNCYYGWDIKELSKLWNDPIGSSVPILMSCTGLTLPVKILCPNEVYLCLLLPHRVEEIEKKLKRRNSESNTELYQKYLQSKDEVRGLYINAEKMFKYGVIDAIILSGFQDKDNVQDKFQAILEKIMSGKRFLDPNFSVSKRHILSLINKPLEIRLRDKTSE